MNMQWQSCCNSLPHHNWYVRQRFRMHVLRGEQFGLENRFYEKKDLDDVPPEVVQELHFVPVEHMDKVITIALRANTILPAIEEAILATPVGWRKQKKT